MTPSIMMQDLRFRTGEEQTAHVGDRAVSMVGFGRYRLRLATGAEQAADHGGTRDVVAWMTDAECQLGNVTVPAAATSKSSLLSDHRIQNGQAQSSTAEGGGAPVTEAFGGADASLRAAWASRCAEDFTELRSAGLAEFVRVASGVLAGVWGTAELATSAGTAAMGCGVASRLYVTTGEAAAKGEVQAVRASPAAASPAHASPLSAPVPSSALSPSSELARVRSVVTVAGAAPLADAGEGEAMVASGALMLMLPSAVSQSAYWRPMSLSLAPLLARVSSPTSRDEAAAAEPNAAGEAGAAGKAAALRASPAMSSSAARSSSLPGATPLLSSSPTLALAVSPERADSLAPSPVDATITRLLADISLGVRPSGCC